MVLLYPGWGPQVLAPAIPPVIPPWLRPPMAPVKDPPIAVWSTWPVVYPGTAPTCPGSSTGR